MGEQAKQPLVITTVLPADVEKSSPLSSRTSIDTPPPSYDDAVSPQSSVRERLLNLQFILLNTASTVAIVFMNKTIFSDPQLRRCQCMIAMVHFAATTLVLYVASRPGIGMFKAVRIPLGQLVPISAFFAGFLLLGNWSLALNSVGFYQLAKIMTTPSVVLLNFLIFRRTVTLPTFLSIACVCVGVALTNSRAALSNPLGAIVAVAAFTVTALYQIWIGKKIGDLRVSAPQLLLNQAPVSVLLLACIAPWVDTPPDLAQVQPSVLWTLLLSAMVAALLNLTQFLIIGRTSALTFNIVSNLKNIIILALSWYQERRVPNGQDSIGILLALGGAWAYSQLSSTKRAGAGGAR